MIRDSLSSLLYSASETQKLLVYTAFYLARVSQSKEVQNYDLKAVSSLP